MPMQWPTDEEMVCGHVSPCSLSPDGSLAVDSPRGGYSPSDSPSLVLLSPGCMQPRVSDNDGGSYDNEFAHVTPHASSGGLGLDNEQVLNKSCDAPPWKINASGERGKNSGLSGGGIPTHGTSTTVGARQDGSDIERKHLVPSIQSKTTNCTGNNESFQFMEVTNDNHTGSVFANFESLSRKGEAVKPVFSVPRTSSGGPCQVCGEKASGNFFGALVCLPCKSFFIRCTKEGEPVFVSQCDSRCDVSKQGRNRCQHCRYKKCLAAGMSRKEKPEAVEPGEGQLLCRVCGDIANGIHFGVYTCEGCKKFFRRGLLEYQSYVCKGAMSCLLNPRNRNNCRYCRYQKCLNVGMSRGAIKMGRPKKLGRDHDDLSKIIANRLSNTSVNRNTFCEHREGTGQRLSPSLDDVAVAPKDERGMLTIGRRRSFTPDSDSSSGSGDGKTADQCQKLSRGSLPLKKCILRSLLTVDEAKKAMDAAETEDGTVVADSVEHDLSVTPTCQAHVKPDPSDSGKGHTAKEMGIEGHHNLNVFPNHDACHVSFVNAANEDGRDVMVIRYLSQQFHPSPHLNSRSPSSPQTCPSLLQTTDSDDEASDPKRRRRSDSDSVSNASSPTDIHMDSPDTQHQVYDEPSSPNIPIQMVTEDIPLDLSNSPFQTREESGGMMDGSLKSYPHFPVASSSTGSHCWSPTSRTFAFHTTPLTSSHEMNHNVLGNTHTSSTDDSTRRRETCPEKSASPHVSVELSNTHVHTHKPSLSPGDVLLVSGNYSRSAIIQTDPVPQSPLYNTTSDAPKIKLYQIDGNIMKELNTFFLGSVKLLKNVRQRLESSNYWSHQTDPKCTFNNSFPRPFDHEAKMRACSDPLEYYHRGLATHTLPLSTKPDPSSHLILPEERHLASKLETEYRFPVDRVCQYWSRVPPTPRDIQMSSAQHKVLQDMLEAYMEILKNLSESHLSPEERFSHIEEWPAYEDLPFMEYTVRRIVTYVKEELVFMSKVPGFKDLNPEDRHFVVQNMCFANILLIAAKEWYDAKTKTFFQMFHWKLPELHHLYSYRELAFQLAEKVHELKMDRTEVAMISALNVIAADCSGLKEPEKIEGSRDFLISALTAHLSYKGVDPVSRMKDIFSLMPIFRLCSFWNKNIREHICVCKNGALGKIS